MNAKDAIEQVDKFTPSKPKTMRAATHQLRSGCREDVTAWQYLKEAPIPVWVARAFHDLGDGDLTHRGGDKVRVGDWIITGIDSNAAFVLTDPEFVKCFVALPAA